MALPTIIANNQTAGAIFLNRLGLTVPLSSTLTLTDFAFVDEILADESLHAAILADEILLDFGQGVLTKGDSIKFFNIQTHEVRIPVKTLSDANIASLSGTATVDTVLMAIDDRVLLTAQTTTSENGIWVVKAGAWARPDDMGVGQSAAGAMVTVGQGSVHADELWQCTTNSGTDVVGTNGLAFSQITGTGGAGGTLQDAYVAGNSITTDTTNGNILFSGTENFLVTTASADMDVSGALTFDATTSIGIGTDADTSAINIGTSATARNITLGNATSTTALDLNSGTGGILADSTGTISLDAATASNFTTAAGDLSLIATLGSAVITGGEAVVDAVTITATNAAGGVDINAGTGGITLDSTAAISLDGVGASNFTTDSGALNLVTTTSGIVNVDGIDGVAINSSAGALNLGNDANDGAINIGTGTTAGRAIAIGNTTGTSSATVSAGTGGITLDATQTTITGDLNVQGTTTSFESETVRISDNHLYMNDGYTTEAPQTGGLVVNFDPIATECTPIDTGGFVAGVASTSNATVRVTDASLFATGDFVQVSGANLPANNGLFEVLSANIATTPDTLTIRGIGTTATVEDFTQNQFAADTTVLGQVCHINVSIMRSGTDGIWEFGFGNVTPITFSDLVTNGGTTAVTLQTAYVGGEIITTNATDGDVVIAGTNALNITAACGLNLDTILDFDGTVFDVLMTGNNGFSIDGTASSNITATNTAAATASVLTLEATNTGITSGDATVDINATSTNGSGIINLDAEDIVSIDTLAAGAINIGTDAVANTTTIGNATGTTAVVVNSGTEKVEIDGVTYYGAAAGNPTATTSGFQDGDKYYDTTLDMEMRYDATRAKWLSVEAMTFQWGRNGNTGSGVFYRSTNGRVMSATIGNAMPHNGTIVASGYTRSDSDLATVDYVEGGTSRATQTMTAALTTGVVVNLNGDFTAAGVLSVQNQAGSNTTSNVLGWVKVKWRA